MAKVRLLQTDLHAPWQEGEIVTVQVATVEGDGMYTCDTLETYPANMKDLHAAEIASHQTLISDLREQLAKHEAPSA